MMCYRLKLMPSIAVTVAFFAASISALAQDVIYLKKPGEGETKRKGEIVGWAGDTISIKGRTGVKEFDSDLLIRIETAWHAGHDQGKELLATYQYDAAIGQFASALESESREWMQNIIYAKIVECFLAKEDFGNAAAHFLKVIDDDPQSRFRHLAPLVWTSSRPNRQQLKRANVWLESSEPMITLMGASWLLDDATNEKAKRKMERLARDFDPVIASLAKAQLWRLDKVPPDDKRLTIRIGQIQSMPQQVRCGAWYLVAEAQSKSGRENEAITNFMRIPINDAHHGSLAAASLYQATWLLEKTNRGQQSQAMRNELKEKFGDTVWAN